MQTIDKLVPDTSIIIEGVLSEKLEKKEFKIKELIIHEAVLAELEHQANLGRSTGFIGLDEIKKLKSLFELRFSGKRPSAVEIKHASLGEIDSLIRELAYQEDATLLTGDKVQSEVALAKGMKVLYIEPKITAKKIKLEKFFDETTMSVHLKENVFPYAKKGMPGNWQFITLSKKLLKHEELKEISREIIEEAKTRKDSFIEIEREGSTIIQLGRYRIVITRPPFSDGWEITAVKPIKKLDLKDYKLSEKLMTRVAEQAEGVLIAGSPGMGKSTFAQAISEFYASKEKIVKTVEAPRDLFLSDDITQYAISHSTPQEIHDILLLSRPDYTIFDEMRNTEDFRLFSDLRLAGVGMIGVVHATNPIDAIQRFIGRVEMGVIPQIIDTVVFIKDGTINKVLSLEMTVKVPSGMTEADLARPVVVVNDFETNELVFEIYSYGEQTVVIPVKDTATQSPSQKLAAETIKTEFEKYSHDAEVDVVSDNKCIVYVPESSIARIIGKQGENIGKIEKKLGISIDIQELKNEKESKEVSFERNIDKNKIIFYLKPSYKNKDVDINIGTHYFLTARASKAGLIVFNKRSKIGKALLKAINEDKEIRLTV